MRFQSQHQAAIKVDSGRWYWRPRICSRSIVLLVPPHSGCLATDLRNKGGGGSLMDLGGHCVDLLEMFMGPIKSVQCLTGNLVQSYASEDTAVVLMEFWIRRKRRGGLPVQRPG